MGVRIGRPEYGGAFAAESGAPLRLVLPGESIEQNAGSIQELRVLQPSPARVAPVCVHFGTCGGCSYQHAAYDLQLSIKRQILVGLLDGAGLTGLPEVHTLAGEGWNYRNRIRLRVRAAASGPVEFGYSLAGTNEFLPVTMCPIAAPLLWRTVEALRALIGHDKGAQAWLQAVAEVEIFSDAGQNRLQLRLFLRSVDETVRKVGSFQRFCERLSKQVPELSGADAQLQPELSRRVRQSWPGERWGADGLNYETDGRSYWVSRGAFFQVNRFLVDALVRTVGEQAGSGGGIAWDLFAGVGLFTRALAERFAQVVAVEGAEAAAADLLAGSRAKGGLRLYETVRLPAIEFLRIQQTQRERPDVVVLDPPRAGLGVEGAELLGKISPTRIVYVSCDPITLARDLRVLVDSGYKLQTLHLVDLFPQTFHLESVVMLER